jgi:putative zinc finger/helix-turn-helix YgiT family protein
MRSKLNFDRGSTFECPTCDSVRAHTETVPHRFTYGEGDTAVELSCLLPVRVCDTCGGRYVDEVVEMVRHETICQHLNRLTPTAIRRIREKFGTQAVFGELTGIGEASLSRWETGASMPSKAYDCYLYLLTFTDNIHRLQAHASRVRAEGGAPRAPQFQCIEITEARLAQQRSFSLRRAS